MSLATALRRRPLETALLASFVLHGLAALAIPTILIPSQAHAAPVRCCTTIVRIALPHPALSHRPLAHPTASPHPQPTQTARWVPQISPRWRAMRVAVAHHAASRPVIASAPPIVTAPVTIAATGAALETPTPQPVREIASTAENPVGGYLPLGAEQRYPVLDASTLKALLALQVHVKLTVTVGNDGRTKQVLFSTPLDATMEARIRRLLDDASWDPSVCGGGIPCEGRATLDL